MKNRWWIAGLFPLTASLAFGQGAVTETRGPAGGTITGNISFGPIRFIPPGITAAPYSAEQIQEHVQTLSDGTHITQTRMQTKVYRDSLGRTRTERPIMPGFANANETQSPMVVEITDPQAGVRYTLDTQAKIAHRTTAQPASARAFNNQNPSTITSVAPPPALVAAPPAVAQLAPVLPPGVGGGGGVSITQTVTGRVQANGVRGNPSTEEKLAPQVIEGILAEGTRHTTTIETGTQGNDQPFKLISETWSSPELKVMVLSKNEDPRTGENTIRLINISRNEPDPSLFQPPADYQVVDETGPFTIRYTR
jgi:hypothetical protein